MTTDHDYDFQATRFNRAIPAPPLWSRLSSASTPVISPASSE